MIFDPALRYAKYSDLENALVQIGLHTEILQGSQTADAIVIWIGDARSDPRAWPGRVVVSGRRRAWFLSVSHQQLFRIPNQDSIPGLARAVTHATKQGVGNEVFANIVRDFSLIPVDRDTWHREEAEEQRLAWEECGWFVLPQGEEAQAWGRFSDRLLGPGGDLHPPVPALTWVTPDLSGDPLDALHNTEGLLTLAVFDALRSCTPEGQHVLVLDWDHPCYRFFPHQGVRKPYRDYWAIPVWPRGGSYYFVAPGFEYGVLASHAGKLHIFGQELADASHAAVTKLLGPPKS